MTSFFLFLNSHNQLWLGNDYGKSKHTISYFLMSSSSFLLFFLLSFFSRFSLAKFSLLLIPGIGLTLSFQFKVIQTVKVVWKKSCCMQKNCKNRVKPEIPVCFVFFLIFHLYSFINFTQMSTALIPLPPVLFLTGCQLSLCSIVWHYIPWPQSWKIYTLE